MKTILFATALLLGTSALAGDVSYGTQRNLEFGLPVTERVTTTLGLNNRLEPSVGVRLGLTNNFYVPVRATYATGQIVFDGGLGFQTRFDSRVNLFAEGTFVQGQRLNFGLRFNF